VSLNSKQIKFFLIFLIPSNPCVKEITDQVLTYSMIF
jgi:hypothetical protein